MAEIELIVTTTVGSYIDCFFPIVFSLLNYVSEFRVAPTSMLTAFRDVFRAFTMFPEARKDSFESKSVDILSHLLRLSSK